MEEQIKEKKLEKSNSFLNFISNNMVKILIIVSAAVAIIGPVFFCIITSFKKEVESNGKIKHSLVFEKEYIISVCVVTLIILGILFALTVATYIYNFKKKKEEIKN